MNELSLPPLPALKPRCDLHICTGAPYTEALRDMHTGYGGGDLWCVADKMSAGDLVLSVVDTVPRMVIGLDEVEVDYDPATSTKMECDYTTSVVFDHGILARAVAKRCNMRNIPDQGYFSGHVALKVWRALDAEYRLDIPWFTPSRWRDIQ
jgi:hypothetical protein